MSTLEAKELQLQELEVLESIYNPDELNIISREYPSISLEVKIPFESVGRYGVSKIMHTKHIITESGFFGQHIHLACGLSTYVPLRGANT